MLYLLYFILLWFCVFLGVLVVFWFFFISMMKSNKFECGVYNNKTSRVPLSICFFCVLLLFLVFDVELSLIFNFPLVKTTLKFNLFFVLFLVFLLLLLGLIEEFRRGFMSFKKV